LTGPTSKGGRKGEMKKGKGKVEGEEKRERRGEGGRGEGAAPQTKIL